MAIGTNAKAESNNSLALGAGTEVRGALVNGYSAFTNQQNNNVANGVVAVGNVGSERRIINVAGGENDTDATNVKQLKFVNSNLAKSIAGPTYTGYEANGSTYKAPDFNIKNSMYHTVKEAVEGQTISPLNPPRHIPNRCYKQFPPAGVLPLGRLLFFAGAVHV